MNNEERAVFEEKNKKTRKKITESLANVFPFGTKFDNDTIDNLPQAIEEILTTLRDRVTECYPAKEKQIDEHFDYVISDVRKLMHELM